MQVVSAENPLCLLVNSLREEQFKLFYKFEYISATEFNRIYSSLIYELINLLQSPNMAHLSM